MFEKAVSKINFEIQQIERLFAEYGGLLGKVKTEIPDLVEITALASVLHSFYTGIENIFRCIAEDVDREIPSGAQWHRELLNQMKSSRENRQAVLTASLVLGLSDYLSFRHFYRHGYSFFLDWKNLEKLITSLPTVWIGLKQELMSFLEDLVA